MQLLVERIQILTHLQEFYYHTGCTTEIIIQLSKYCSGMKRISVQNSRRVDDKCVEHLLRLGQLFSLNVAETSVSTNSYAALLSGLPQIQDVTWFRLIDPVLGNINQRLPSVTAFVGRISVAELLVHKCPNITNLSLYSPTQDISGLGELRNVVSISIRNCSSIIIRFSEVIRRLGRRLKTLQLGRVENINMNDLINYCTSLHSLRINFCRMIFTGVFDPELPHFQNLKELRLRRNSGPFDFCFVLHLYVNLSVIHVVTMAQMTDVVIRQIVTGGGFKNITEFVLAHCGYLSMNTAWLLMQNCPNLTKIGNISSWDAVTKEDVVTFMRFVRNTNIKLSLHF
jgi:hypothetical protein